MPRPSRCSRLARPAVVASALPFLLLGSAEASILMEVICDNHFALYAGTATGVGRKVFENNGTWMTQLANASTVDVMLQAGETHYYLLAMGGGLVENIGGRVNGVDLATIPVSRSSDISGFLTGFSSSYDPAWAWYADIVYGTYVSQIADVQTALADAGTTWGTPSVTYGGVGASVTGAAFDFGAFEARLFRFAGSDVGVSAASAVPLPGAAGLAACGLLGLSRRRRC